MELKALAARWIETKGTLRALRNSLCPRLGALDSYLWVKLSSPSHGLAISARTATRHCSPLGHTKGHQSSQLPVRM
jgi:hypothetical protein